MKVVLDTNVLLQSFSPRSKYSSILTSLLEGRFSMYLTTEIWNEYEEVFQRKASLLAAELLFRLLDHSDYVHFVNSYFKWQLIAIDPDDNKFVDCAVAVGADFIITNDKHFDVLSQIQFPKVTVLSGEKFLEILTNHYPTSSPDLP